MQPTVGRIVHYQAYGTPGGEYPSVPRAAMIAAVLEDGECDLVVFNPQGLFFNRCKFSEKPVPGCWNWPPRQVSTRGAGGLHAGEEFSEDDVYADDAPAGQEEDEKTPAPEQRAGPGEAVNFGFDPKP